MTKTIENMILRELDNQSFETLIEATAMRYIVKCDDLNKKIIIQDLRNEMGMFKVDDFNLAISKHVSGKFAISNNSDNNKPYGGLSSHFVCQVLNGYKEFVRKAKMNAKQLPSNYLLIPEGKKSEEQVLREQKEEYEFIDNEFNKNKKLPFSANWSDAFLHMERNGIIEKFEKDHKEMFRENVIADIEHRIKQYKILGKMVNTLSMMITKDELLAVECRKRMIINYYKNR